MMANMHVETAPKMEKELDDTSWSAVPIPGMASSALASTYLSESRKDMERRYEAEGGDRVLKNGIPQWLVQDMVRFVQDKANSSQSTKMLPFGSSSSSSPIASFRKQPSELSSAKCDLNKTYQNFSLEQTTRSPAARRQSTLDKMLDNIRKPIHNLREERELQPVAPVMTRRKSSVQPSHNAQRKNSVMKGLIATAEIAGAPIASAIISISKQPSETEPLTVESSNELSTTEKDLFERFRLTSSIVFVAAYLRTLRLAFRREKRNRARSARTIQRKYRSHRRNCAGMKIVSFFAASLFFCIRKRIRQKRRAALVVHHFLKDAFSSHSPLMFRRFIAKIRYCQRIARGYLEITRARHLLMTLYWEKLERQLRATHARKELVLARKLKAEIERRISAVSTRSGVHSKWRVLNTKAQSLIMHIGDVQTDVVMEMERQDSHRRQMEKEEKKFQANEAAANRRVKKLFSSSKTKEGQSQASHQPSKPASPRGSLKPRSPRGAVVSDTALPEASQRQESDTMELKYVKVEEETEGKDGDDDDESEFNSNRFDRVDFKRRDDLIRRTIRMKRKLFVEKLARKYGDKKGRRFSLVDSSHARALLLGAGQGDQDDGQTMKALLDLQLADSRNVYRKDRRLTALGVKNQTTVPGGEEAGGIRVAQPLLLMLTDPWKLGRSWRSVVEDTVMEDIEMKKQLLMSSGTDASCPKVSVAGSTHVPFGGALSQKRPPPIEIPPPDLASVTTATASPVDEGPSMLIPYDSSEIGEGSAFASRVCLDDVLEPSSPTSPRVGRPNANASPRGKPNRKGSMF